MASESAVNAKSATLSTTTVDTITLTGRGNLLTIVNRDASTGTVFWATFNTTGGTAATPTAAGDECYPVFPSSSISFRVRAAAGAASGVAVKILGNSHPYTVMLTDTPGT